MWETRLHMRILKRCIIFSIVGLVAAGAGLAWWFTRVPTTQLVDAAGNALTIGTTNSEEADSPGGSLFDEPRELIRRKEFVAARGLLTQIIEESDRDGEACVLLCDVARELKEVEAATDYGLKAVTLLPDSAEAHLTYAKAVAAQIAADMQSLGGMLSAMKRVGLLKTELNRVIELDSQDTEARTMLVFTNMAPGPMGDLDRAVALCGEIEALDPVLGKQLLAMCYRRMQEDDRAIDLLLASLEEYPDANSLHVALADIYAEQKRFGDADAEYEAARTAEENEAYYRSLYGQARMRIRNEFEPSRAVELLDEYIAAEPETEGMETVAHACWRKGNALEQLGRNEDARDAYEESLRQDPSLELARKALEALKD